MNMYVCVMYGVLLVLRLVCALVDIYIHVHMYVYIYMYIYVDQTFHTSL